MGRTKVHVKQLLAGQAFHLVNSFHCILSTRGEYLRKYRFSQFPKRHTAFEVYCKEPGCPAILRGGPAKESDPKGDWYLSLSERHRHAGFTEVDERLILRREEQARRKEQARRGSVLGCGSGQEASPGEECRAWATKAAASAKKESGLADARQPVPDQQCSAVAALPMANSDGAGGRAIDPGSAMQDAAAWGSRVATPDEGRAASPPLPAVLPTAVQQLSPPGRHAADTANAAAAAANHPTIIMQHPQATAAGAGGWGAWPQPASGALGHRVANLPQHHPAAVAASTTAATPEGWGPPAAGTPHNLQQLVTAFSSMLTILTSIEDADTRDMLVQELTAANALLRNTAAAPALEQAGPNAAAAELPPNTAAKATVAAAADTAAPDAPTPGLPGPGPATGLALAAAATAAATEAADAAADAAATRVTKPAIAVAAAPAAAPAVTPSVAPAAKVDDPVKDGSMQPLHLAATCGSLPTEKLLLQRGADVEAENEKGLKPLQVARRQKQRELVVQVLTAERTSFEAHPATGAGCGGESHTATRTTATTTGAAAEPAGKAAGTAETTAVVTRVSGEQEQERQPHQQSEQQPQGGPSQVLTTHIAIKPDPEACRYEAVARQPFDAAELKHLRRLYLEPRQITQDRTAATRRGTLRHCDATRSVAPAAAVNYPRLWPYLQQLEQQQQRTAGAHHLLQVLRTLQVHESGCGLPTHPFDLALGGLMPGYGAELAEAAAAAGPVEEEVQGAEVVSLTAEEIDVEKYVSVEVRVEARGGLRIGVKREREE